MSKKSWISKGVFAFDGVIRNMIFQMRNLLSEGKLDREIRTIRLYLGIDIDREGKLTMDDEKFDAAYAATSITKLVDG